MATEGPKRPLPDDSTEESSIVLKKQKTESAVSTAQQQPGVSSVRHEAFLAGMRLLSQQSNKRLIANYCSGSQENVRLAGSHYAVDRSCWRGFWRQV